MSEMGAILKPELSYLYGKLLQACALLGCSHISGYIKLSLISLIMKKNWFGNWLHSETNVASTRKYPFGIGKFWIYIFSNAPFISLNFKSWIKLNSFLLAIYSAAILEKVSCTQIGVVRNNLFQNTQCQNRNCSYLCIYYDAKIKTINAQHCRYLGNQSKGYP